METWLVGVDLLRAHRAPLEQCAKMAQAASARLLLVHVSDPGDPAAPAAVGHSDDDLELAERLRELGMTADEMRRNFPRLQIELRAVRGEIAPVLLDEADWAGATQIVIGTHKRERDPAEVAPEESVTMALLRDAAVPVVVLRAPRTERHVRTRHQIARVPPPAASSDPLKTLLSFHGQIRGAIQNLDDIATLASAEGVVPAHLAAELLAFLTGPLVWHDIDEETSVIDRLRKVEHPPRLERILDQCAAAHRAMEGAIARLVPHLTTIAEGGAPDPGRLRTAAEKLRVHLGPHLRMEEQEVFPLARLLLADNDLVKIRQEFEARARARTDDTAETADAATA